jgi:hypothetical protein
VCDPGGEGDETVRPNWNRWLKWCRVLSCGGVTFGILQGLGMINWSYFLAQFLGQWLSTLVALLLGGQNNSLLTGQTGTLTNLLNLGQ